MPCFTGEDVAKEFKNDEHRPLIIFTTSHSDFAKRGYRYNVYDFLDKSDIDNELINILNNSIKDLTTKRKEELVEYFEEQEAFKDFIKINRNTIVNYDFILSIDDNKIKMNNGVIFDVPKIKTNEIKMKIMQIGINRHGIY